LGLVSLSTLFYSADRSLLGRRRRSVSVKYNNRAALREQLGCCLDHNIQNHTITDIPPLQEAA